MNPIAFTLFGYDIRWYSLLILAGVFIGYILVIREAKKFKISKDFVFNTFFWSLVIGIIGARLYYVLFNWDYFGSHIGEIWQIWQGGLAIHGGIIFGIITIAIYCKNHDFRLARMLDLLAPSLILAQAIGRWGNFFNVEAYGNATTLAHLEKMHIPGFIIDGMNINGVYYTPTFFYESVWCLIGFFVIYFFRKRKMCKVSQASGLYLIWYSFGRFFIESSRTDSLILLGFKVAQFVSIIMFIIGIVLLIASFQKGKYEDLYNDVNNV